MLKITYTNGDTQSINVTGDFFTITLAPKNGKIVKLLPMEKAEELAFDLAIVRSIKAPGSQAEPDVLVSSIALYWPDNPDPKVKVFRPVDDVTIHEKETYGPSFIKEKKRLKKVWRNNKNYTTYWKWTF